MAISSDHIRHTFAGYVDTCPDDKGALSPVLAALDARVDLSSRKTFPLHVTAGAVLVNDTGNVLLIHHNGTGRWLTPGGHLEPGDTHLMGAALRELAEETGIDTGVVAMLNEPVHIDVHPIPSNPARGEPEHQHADVRYLLRATGDVDTVLQREEVSGAEWRPVGALSAALRSRVRAALR
ncbi:NUDIX hydrolase [Streptomyces profundus]|uniref:NUDIX hydrolase n=1 Tax=Streptomyces profundus TaxID=2867410 RepID=UPI001D16B4D8|nr:NUDIX hydrolase [Streptomyces sp. MA3_2.13]UED83276.1 NUDIX hydrolase [Streptomyces sp. MA3_2.13]